MNILSDRADIQGVGTLHGLVDYWNAFDPNAEACVDSARRFTYGQLAERIDGLAAAFLKFGVRRGDRVATLAPPSTDFLECFLAAVSIGAIWVGLNPKYTRRELSYVLSDAEPALVLTRSHVRGRDFREEFESILTDASYEARLVVGEEGAGDPLLAGGETPDACLLDEARSEVGPESEALIIYTSGTTGAPKGAVIKHGALTRTSLEQVKILGLPRPRVINNLPINHIGCVGDLGLYGIAAGGAQVFQERFDAAGVIDLIERERVTFWGQIPTMFQMTLDAVDVSKRDLSSLEMIMWSGAPASLALARKLRSIARISNSYGMTETVGSVTWCVDADDETMTSTVGWPHAAYDVRIAGEDGADADIGETGEIQVKGDFVMSGYWRRTEASREAFTPDGWLKTGDLAQRRKDGAYQLVGRLKEMFKSGGYNVYPREIEMILEELPDVDAAIVVSAPDEIYGEVGCAFVQAKGDAAEVGALERACREKLANYKVPKRFILTDEFPALPNGKIDKAALRAMAAKSAAGE